MLRRLPVPFVAAAAAFLLCGAVPAAHAQRGPANGPVHGQRPARLIIRNALVYEGNGTPAEGPKDIVVENGKITSVTPMDAVSRGGGRGRGGAAAGAVEIDASGKFVMPGLINAHGHVQEERAGIPQPLAYELKIWLACGITTVRDVGSMRSLTLRDSSARGLIESPRIVVYPQFGSPSEPTEAATRQRVRDYKARGVDGIKFVGTDKDIYAWAVDEAHKLGLRVAHHVGVEDANAWDDIANRTTSIEHWYGIPDAAIPDRVQHFPSSYNYLNETDRFRWAGRLWREADPAILTRVLKGMIDSSVAWVPTLDIYEASRDLQRAQGQPWFKDYLHPTLEEYFKPDPSKHGSYFIGWTSTDEAYWKENYRIWMSAVRQFENMGGIVGAGDDAGFIYQMYGFGLIRELELHQEAGFHTIKVLQHATGNNAKILGMETQIGRIRQGYAADILIVNGNPLEDLKVLYPTGTTAIVDGKEVHTGGVEWTIKDGIPYHVPQLMSEVKDIVARARSGKQQ